MPQSTLTVWKFATPQGAGEAVRTLEDMQKQELITILDFATVSWEDGKKKPNTRQGSPTASATARRRSARRPGRASTDSACSRRT